MHPVAALGWAVAGAAAEAAAVIPWPSQSKLARTFALRRGLDARFAAFAREGRRRERPLVWFHAPSVGEGLQVRPVLQRLRVAHPEWQVAYTFFSPSAERFAAGLGADFVAPLPFDTRRGARMALEALAPSALVFGKLDVWPVLVAEAAARGVSVGMISATLADGAGRTSPWARALLGEAYATLDGVGAVDPNDADRLRALGVRPEVVSVTGDTRYDQVWARASSAPSDAAVQALREAVAPDAPLIVAGSTWPADDAVLTAAWPRLREAVPRARLLVAPHELHAGTFAPYEAMARTHGLTVARLDAPSAPSADLVLVDRVGVLGDLYGAARVAFVGGGFHAAGLHSVLEPAAFGVPVLCGPRDAAQRDAEALAAVGGLVRVSSADALVEQCRRWLLDAGAHSAATQGALGVVRGGLGAADRSLDLVQRLVVNGLQSHRKEEGGE